jgi:hypothetical protein
MRLAALVLALSCAACSLVLSPSDLMDGSEPLPPLSAREFCDQLAEAYCLAHENCCDPDETLDLASCLDSTRLICDGVVIIASDPRTAYNGATARELLEESERLFEACDPSVLPLLLGAEGLTGTLDGTVPSGSACSTRDAPELAEFFSCQDNRACVRVGASRWNCLARVPEGGTCRTDSDCEDGLFCDSGWLGILDGSCVAQRAEGADCSRANECASYQCAGEDESVCQPLTVDAVYCVLGE